MASDALANVSFVNGSVRTVLRTVLIVVTVVLTLYVMYLLRRPIGWLLIATFIAVALAGPVNFLHRHMRRGFAIAIVYIGLLLVPIGLGALIIPPVVTQVESFANNAPQYASDVSHYIQENGTLRGLQEKYDIGTQLEEK